MGHYKGLTDSSIPFKMDEFESELSKAENTDEVTSGARRKFLEDIESIIAGDSRITLAELQSLSPDEIYNLCSVAGADNSPSIFELEQILGAARKEFKNMILTRVLKLSKNDFMDDQNMPTDYVI